VPEQTEPEQVMDRLSKLKLTKKEQEVVKAAYPDIKLKEAVKEDIRKLEK
jgi:hypothetical protein